MADQINLNGKTRDFNPSGDMTKSAYWLGGTDATHRALSQYDLLRTGYGRLFILRMPAYVETLIPDATKKFKHMLEYANVGVDGISGYTADFASVTAGYSGNTVEIPMNVKDDTNSITIKVYETSGSLFRKYIDFWLTGVGDPFTGFSHYHGIRNMGGQSNYVFSQANQTMEAIWVATDQSGMEMEYACLLANMFPKGSDHSHFSYEPGSHDLVNLSIEFTAIKYMSSQIDSLGKALLDKYLILKNYRNFKSEYTTNDIEASNYGENGVGKGIWEDYQVEGKAQGEWNTATT